MKGVNTMISSVGIYLILPYVGAILAYILGKMNEKSAFWVAEIVGAILFGTSIYLFMNYTALIDIDYTWINYGGIQLPLGIYIDHLSVVMLLIATGLGFADIHFAHDYMGEDPDKQDIMQKYYFLLVV
jgi:NADH-quinone oxidoreductase subunit L